MPETNVMKSFESICSALTESKRKALSAEIEDVRRLISSLWWTDPVRRNAVSQAMRASWDGRRMQYRITWRSGEGEKVVNSIEEAASVVNRRPHTVRCYLSQGRGTAHFVVEDDSVTITQIYP